MVKAISGRIGHLTLVPQVQAFVISEPLKGLIDIRHIPQSFGCFELVTFQVGKNLFNRSDCSSLLKRATNIFKQKAKENPDYFGPGADNFRIGGITKVVFYFEIKPSEKGLYLVVVGTHEGTSRMQMEELLSKI